MDARITGNEKATGALTRPSFRVNSTTRWEVNITRKYRVASSTMVSKILRALIPGALDFTAQKIINENARKSNFHIYFSQG